MLKRRFVVTAEFHARSSAKTHGKQARVRKGTHVFADTAIDGSMILFEIEGKHFEVEREVFELCTRRWKERAKKVQKKTGTVSPALAA
jgi:hypothetical protein